MRSETNHVSKEDYEAQQLREEMEGGDENQVQSGFTQASAEVMKTRRKVCGNQFKRSAGLGALSGAAVVRPSVGVPCASGNNVAVPNVSIPKAGSSGGGGVVHLIIRFLPIRYVQILMEVEILCEFRGALLLRDDAGLLDLLMFGLLQ